jgi:hypothetical protein
MMSALKNPAQRSMAVACLTPRVSLGGFVQVLIDGRQQPLLKIRHRLFRCR